MQRDDERLQLPGDGKHAEHRLDENRPKQCDGVRRAEQLLAAIPDRQCRDRHDYEHQGAGGVAMDHLLPGLARIEWPIRKSGLRRRIVLRTQRSHVPITTRPVGTAESRRVEPHIGPEDDNNETKQHACKRKTADIVTACGQTFLGVEATPTM